MHCVVLGGWVGARHYPLSLLALQLLQAAAVLLLRDCYVSFAESTGKSSDKKQFIIADETGEFCTHLACTHTHTHTHTSEPTFPVSHLHTFLQDLQFGLYQTLFKMLRVGCVCCKEPLRTTTGNYQ